MNFKELCIDAQLQLCDAMKKLNITEYGILFIIDNLKLVAALSDGDIRRYQLVGGKITDPASNAANYHPILAHSVEEAEKLYDIRNCNAVPIVDAEGNITNIYVGKLLEIPAKHLKVPVVINAGGKGTRLEPYTKILPKPLIPVGELPIIEHIMQHYMQFGCDEFHIIVNHKKELIKSYFKECDYKYNVSFYDEEKPLHTGGGMFLLKGILNETFFLNNCDIIIQEDYSKILDFHREKKSLITMVCANKDMALPYGIIETDTNQEIIQIKEKPLYTFKTNTGMYLLEPEVFDEIEDNIPQKFTDIVEKEKEKSHRTFAYIVKNEQWLDMGNISELERMRKYLYG